MNKIQLVLITLCWNEQDNIPFVIDYWKRYFTDHTTLKVVVYDNYSTDKSVEMLSKYDWIEIRQFQTDGMNDVVQQYIKNNAWKEFKETADFIIVCDMDEMLYFNTDIIKTLYWMKKGGYNVLGTKWYMMCSDKEPVYTEGKLLHELCPRVCYQDVNRNRPDLGKYMLIDPKMIDDMNWSVGNHIASPKPFINIYEAAPIDCFALHINKGFSEDYFVNRRKYMFERLSDVNKKYGLCIEYGYPEEQTRNEYRDNVKKSFDLNELMKKG